MKLILFNSLLPISFFIVVGLVYTATMMPSQAFHDAGEFQTIIKNVHIAHPTGYPTYILLGKLFTTLVPFGELAWKVNFLSVIYAVGALVCMYWLLFSLTKQRVLPLISVATFAFVKPFWYYSGIATPHTLNLFFMFLLMLAFLKVTHSWNSRLVYLFGLLYGLGLGNHLLLLYLIPGFIVWFFLTVRNHSVQFWSSKLLIMISGGLLGLLVYLFLPIRDLWGPGLSRPYVFTDAKSIIRYITGADFQGLMYQGGITKVMQNSMGGLVALGSFITSIGALLALLGSIYALKRYPAVGIFLFISFFLLVLFVNNYPTSDISRYQLTYIGIACVFMGLGITGLSKFLDRALHKLGFLIDKKIITIFLLVLFILTPINLFKSNFSSADKSKDYSAVVYSKDVFQSLSKESIILSWWNYSTPLWYRQEVLGERPDILIINIGQQEWESYIDKYIGQRPVYAVEQEREAARVYNFEKNGGIYKVFAK